MELEMRLDQHHEIVFTKVVPTEHWVTKGLWSGQL